MDLSIVFPCLNEEETLGACIDEVNGAFAGAALEYEVVVADNGSTDASAQIARDRGARVVAVTRRGYGAALKGGIAAARGRHVIFADADGSYKLGDARALYEEAVRHDADMVIASRMKGGVEPGAMPWLHRFVGTPVLTLLINLLFRGRLSDCNAGFRCIRKSAFAAWRVRADGMEFASELLIKALKCGSRIVEIPSGLRRDRRSRPPHLRTWRDGMRHLLFIFSERPEFFEWAGLGLVFLTSLVQVLAYLVGPTRLLVFNIFDYHTQALLIPLGCSGIQAYLFSCYLYMSGAPGSMPLTRRLIGLDEAHLFFLLLAIFAAQGVVVLAVFWRWSAVRFAGLDIISGILCTTHFLSILGFVGVGLLGIHVFRSHYVAHGNSEAD